MKAWSWFRYNARWTAALLVAGACSLWNIRGWARIGKAFALWFGLLKHPREALAPSGLVKLRLEACKACALFYSPLGTCGTPVVKELRAHGCYCFMFEAAKLHAKQCYLDEFIAPGYPGGWEDTISRAQGSQRDNGVEG